VVAADYSHLAQGEAESLRDNFPDSSIRKISLRFLPHAHLKMSFVLLDYFLFASASLNPYFYVHPVVKFQVVPPKRDYPKTQFNLSNNQTR
jgi:hypothetical protein